MAIYEVLYYDPRTGRQKADSDTNVGEGYLDRLAEKGVPEIAAAVRQDQTEPWRYLVPHSHEWATMVPAVIREAEARASRTDWNRKLHLACERLPDPMSVLYVWGVSAFANPPRLDWNWQVDSNLPPYQSAPHIQRGSEQSEEAAMAAADAAYAGIVAAAEAWNATRLTRERD